jgi:hypothetical protein
MTTALLAVLASCSDSTEPACFFDGTPPICVDVFDAATGSPAAYAATLTLTLGSVAKTVDPLIPAAESLNVARIEGIVGEFAGQPGVYDVRVERSGYEPWVRSNVVVTAPVDQCGRIQTIVLTALLVRSNGG